MFDGDCAPATGACARRAAEAVPARDDASSGEFRRVEIVDCLRQLAGDAEFEHLVEVAIVKPPRPIHADEVTTH